MFLEDQNWVQVDHRGRSERREGHPWIKCKMICPYFVANSRHTSYLRKDVSPNKAKRTLKMQSCIVPMLTIPVLTNVKICVD